MKNIFKKVLCSVAVAFSCVFAAKVADAQTVYMGIQVENGHNMSNFLEGGYIGVCLRGSGFKALAQIIKVVGHHLLVQYDDGRLFPTSDLCYYISGPYDDTGHAAAWGMVRNYYSRTLFSTYDAVAAYDEANYWTSLYDCVRDASNIVRFTNCSEPYVFPAGIRSNVLLNVLTPQHF